MAKMSNAQAEFIARDLLKERSLNIYNLEIEKYQKLTEWYNDSLPKEVLAFFKKHKKYCKITTSIKISGVGHTSHKCYAIEESASGTSWTNCLNLSDEKAQWLTDINNKIADQKAERDKLGLNIQAALKNLTRKQLLEEFPEVAPYLVEKPSTALAINLVDLRKKILP